MKYEIREMKLYIVLEAYDQPQLKTAHGALTL